MRQILSGPDRTLRRQRGYGRGAGMLRIPCRKYRRHVAQRLGVGYAETKRNTVMNNNTDDIEITSEEPSEKLSVNYGRSVFCVPSSVLPKLKNAKKKRYTDPSVISGGYRRGHFIDRLILFGRRGDRRLRAQLLAGHRHTDDRR